VATEVVSCCCGLLLARDYIGQLTNKPGVSTVLGLQSEQTPASRFENEQGYPAEPHFSDRKTLRSARRVVPLTDLTTKAGRRWRLAGALGAALLLGASAALVIAYFQIRSRQQVVANQIELTNSTQPGTNAEAVASPEETETVDSSTATEDIPEKGQAVAIGKRPKKEPNKIALRAAETKLHDTPLVVNDPQVAESEPAPDQTEQLPADRWEERRQRRLARRERRLQNRDDGRGLFRIREIFEGQNHP